VRRHGSPYLDLGDRLLSNSVDMGGHWVWLGHCSHDGYGRITLWLPGTGRRRVMQAHRVSYEWFIGPVPADHDLDHSPDCPYRSCIHPNCLTPKPWKQHRAQTRFGRVNPPSPLQLELTT
jgi:hypothetical protein